MNWQDNISLNLNNLIYTKDNGLQGNIGSLSLITDPMKNGIGGQDNPVFTVSNMIISFPNFKKWPHSRKFGKDIGLWKVKARDVTNFKIKNPQIYVMLFQMIKNQKTMRLTWCYMIVYFQMEKTLRFPWCYMIVYFQMGKTLRFTWCYMIVFLPTIN